MKPRILLVNPPIYDFAAFDFWLKPYGMLNVAGKLRGQADFALFDYLDRLAPVSISKKTLESDQWGRGRFYYEKIESPGCLKMIPRHYRRFGLPRSQFQKFLSNEKPFDFAMVQTTMTYWYPGVREVIEDIRNYHPGTKIILGGNYVTICINHAKNIGADLLIERTNLNPLWQYLGITADLSQPALWEIYDNLKVGTLKLSDGCPFNCTYCSVPKLYGKFMPRSLELCLAEFELLVSLGAGNIAFYDDALLFEPQKVLVPFLKRIIESGRNVNFHSPNALNARFVTPQLAGLMIKAGFKTFCLGFESVSSQWQKQTGSKVFSQELAAAVERLLAAGASAENITAYQILSHPFMETQQLETSMYFVQSLGIRGMLADFSPIPGTPDGEFCRKWVNLEEPLMHNKTAFPVILMGFDESNRLKDLQRKLNRELLLKEQNTE
jgi:hypothetical protein